MEATYKVEGMTCGGCVRSVQRALSAALPAAKIEVSLDKAQVHVDGEHQVKAVESAIIDAGFDFGGAVA